MNTKCTESQPCIRWLPSFVGDWTQNLAKTLYSKRFFPFYTFNLLAGLTPEGEPRVYGYDAIGSYDVCPYAVQGSGQQLMIALLDNQFQQYHQIQKNIPKINDLSNQSMLWVTSLRRPTISAKFWSTLSSLLQRETSTPVTEWTWSSSERVKSLSTRVSRSDPTNVRHQEPMGLGKPLKELKNGAHHN